MVDFLDEKRTEIRARLDELKPLVDEYHRLEAAAAALDGIGQAATATPPAARRRRASRSTAASAPAPKAATAGRRGRPAGSGKRAAEALALVTATPGITIPELAEKMGIKHNYLYRVLPGLVQAGQVVKDGRGWRPTPAG